MASSPSVAPSSYALSRSALFSFKAVVRATSTDDDCVRWCQEAGLLRARMRCPKCDRDMKLHIRSHRWRCSRKGCALERSVRTGSIFSDSKMAISDCVLLLLLWSARTSVPVAAEWVEVSAPTVLEWFSLCRAICVKEMQSCENSNNYSHDPQAERELSKELESLWRISFFDAKASTRDFLEGLSFAIRKYYAVA